MPYRNATHPLALALSTALALGGCATTADCVAPVGNPNLTPALVSASQGHTGENPRWGGTLVETRNLPDSTELTVLAFPLDRCGRPRLDEPPSGRFVAVVPGYLEPTDYAPDRLVTATGLITGTREEQIGEAPYRLPVLSKARVRLWPVADQSGPRPYFSIGIGGGSGGFYGGGVGTGIGVRF